MTKARIFKWGSGQVVRLPKQFQFHAKKVEIMRRGNEIILREPKRNLGKAFEALSSMRDDFMTDNRQDAAPQTRHSR